MTASIPTPKTGTPGRRTILHVDMDAFFASVEVLCRPELAGRPVIVSGDPSLRTVVSSCSYEARAMGVRSGMPLARALRLAPGASVVSGDHHRYVTCWKRILSVMLSLTHRIEPVSIDEAFLDATGLPMAPCALAELLQRRLLDETGLWASVGIGSNKLLAKMASKRAKPRGIRELRPEDIVDFPVDSIWGVGPETARLLGGFGVKTVADLAAFPAQRLRIMLGMAGESLYFLCRGVDPSPVIPFYEQEPPQSIGHEHTFARDVLLPGEYLPALALLAQKVARRSRDEGFAGSLVTLKYRFSDMSTHTRAVRLGAPTDQDQVIFRAVGRLAGQCVKRPVRLLGVCLGSLAPSAGLQLPLFNRSTHELNRACDMIRRRYGEKAVTSCRTISAVRR
ncbi:DNA polymerase IV [Candidatus Fermentibacteria bacterium]|nr:DNA polymerase IV [Candidatus Fermentibacteria bacterium]